MKKYIQSALKVILSLLLLMPILGTLGIFPEPTRDMYSSDQAYNFISALMDAGYIMPIMAASFLAALILLWTKREAVAALLILPFTVNIVAFHLFLDGGLLTGGAVMGNVLLLLNIYLMKQNCPKYKALCGCETK